MSSETVLAKVITARLVDKVYLAKHLKEDKSYVVKRLNVFEIKDKERESIENEVW